MSSNTKIYVISRKKLTLTLAAFIIIAIAAIAMLFMFSKNDSSKKEIHTHSNGIISEAQYIPGVYTASVTLDGTPVNVIVTVDENNINDIRLEYTSDAITTMYPMLEDNFNELADKVISNKGVANISYNTDNKYTTTILLDAISQALKKCVVST